MSHQRRSRTDHGSKEISSIDPAGSLRVPTTAERGSGTKPQWKYSWTAASSMRNGTARAETRATNSLANTMRSPCSAR
jgi:hypothetical protein